MTQWKQLMTLRSELVRIDDTIYLWRTSTKKNPISQDNSSANFPRFISIPYLQGANTSTSNLQLLSII
jgi:hypothetical protein